MTRLSHLRRDESGMSLVELLVSMAIGAVLLTMVATFFVNTARATTTAEQTRDSATVAGNIANAVSTGIRFGTQNPVRNQLAPDPAIVEGTAASVTLYTLLPSTTATPSLTAAPVPVKVRYRIVGGEYVEERWVGVTADGYTTFATGAANSTRNLGGTVVAQTAAAQQPFVYLDSKGNVIAPGTGLSLAQRASVASIRINVYVRSPKSPTAKVTVIENTVGMPNLLYTGETP